MQRALAFTIVAVSAALAGCTVGAGGPEAVGLTAEADQADGFYADFAGCREVANVGNLPMANARPLVPPQFTLVGEGTATAEFVVRTVHCDAISVDGGEGRPGDLAQIGIVIVAPGGNDADINNYTLYYDTNDARLAAHLLAVGVDALFVPDLEESLAVNPDGSGQYHFADRGPSRRGSRTTAPSGRPWAGRSPSPQTGGPPRATTRWRWPRPSPSSSPPATAWC